MKNALSVLVVDVSRSWEEYAKAVSRGYAIKQAQRSRRFYRDPERLEKDLCLEYPHGSLRAGFDAIIDTVRLAHQLGLMVYAAEYDAPWACEDDVITCDSLQPYIPPRNRYRKKLYDAFSCAAFVRRLERDRCGRLLVIGYDRDCCVMQAAMGGLAHGLKVVTSESCMLTVGTPREGRVSHKWYRSHTTYLEGLPEVWNYMSRSL
jgi:hypothetical protein